MNETSALVNRIIEKHNYDRARLIMILQDIQAALKYLPPETIDLVSDQLHLSRAQVYSVATFYKSFSLQPRGKHKIDICEGTACHIRGASVLMNQVSDQLGIKAGETSADGAFTLESVHCVGACAMAPVVVIDGSYHGGITAAKLAKEIKKCSADHDCACSPDVAAEPGGEPAPHAIEKISSRQQLDRLQDRLREKSPVNQPRILVCAGTGCLAMGSLAVAEALGRELAAAGSDLPVKIGFKKVGCQGFCEKGPLVIIYPENILYTGVSPDDAGPIVQKTVIEKKVIDKLLYHQPGEPAGIEKYTEIPFFSWQKRTALRHVGSVDPLDINDYIACGGYGSLLKALYSMQPDQVITAVERSGLRGRGGGGFPAGKKWRTAAAVQSDLRYVICNGDEGDPGAFMDRSIMEGDPHSVIEGMVICAFAVGAANGYIYVREEYPRALAHLQTAIDQARQAGFLGPNIGGTDFSFDLQINRGTGAFICGESTALMQSVEGKVGEPRAKYIRSAERGLYDKPTVLNNVETFVNIPLIIEQGAAQFAATGTAGSTGTKVFSVVGKVKNTGLVEVPMGTTLRTIIFDVCGGILEDKQFKAVQTGGPSGGCLPESKLDLPVDFDTLTREGSMMGSGGMIVMDEDTCMVDVARYFTDFLTRESCGKCAACRLGLDALLAILERICRGEGAAADIDQIEQLLFTLENGSLCGLGKSAPNPVRSTLTHFKDEYLAHIIERKCPAGVCRSLISYEINDRCTGCRLCAKACPQQAISGTKKERHRIDQALCDRCGICKATCSFNAVVVSR
jgi:NADH:ubiquinone oxidoreductase subunit F (NADH-binding)/NADH:ubiquinone oxidoreductase subunit E/Pyruvate/2-oxoacid:ferredoxin oxidoreductase delta subunit